MCNIAHIYKFKCGISRCACAQGAAYLIHRVAAISFSAILEGAATVYRSSSRACSFERSNLTATLWSV